MIKPFSYNKEEKLKSRKLLEQLFATGKSLLVFPIKVFYLQVQEPIDFPIKVGVGTSTRNFKKATDRNRIKRLLREAYRTNKLPLHTFTSNNQKQVAVFFLYIDKALPDGKLLQTKMPIAIEKVINALA